MKRDMQKKNKTTEWNKVAKEVGNLKKIIIIEWTYSAAENWREKSSSGSRKKTLGK